MSTKTIKEDQEYAVERLLSYYLSKGDRVYTIQRHVSASGMSRDISLIYVKAGVIHNITYSAALALGWPLSEKSGNRAIRVSGCGMDMGFHTVYTLSSVVYRGTVESDAGYLLEHRWL